MNKLNLIFSWLWLSSGKNSFSGRAAHTGVYIKETDSLYVFGGFDLNKVLGDLSIYKFNTSSWESQNGNFSGNWLYSNN